MSAEPKWVEVKLPSAVTDRRCVQYAWSDDHKQLAVAVDDKRVFGTSVKQYFAVFVLDTTTFAVDREYEIEPFGDGDGELFALKFAGPNIALLCHGELVLLAPNGEINIYKIDYGVTEYLFITRTRVMCICSGYDNGTSLRYSGFLVLLDLDKATPDPGSRKFVFSVKEGTQQVSDVDNYSAYLRLMPGGERIALFDNLGKYADIFTTDGQLIKRCTAVDPDLNEPQPPPFLGFMSWTSPHIHVYIRRPPAEWSAACVVAASLQANNGHAFRDSVLQDGRGSILDQIHRFLVPELKKPLPRLHVHRFAGSRFVIMNRRGKKRALASL